MPIRVLTPQEAARIAAGEVIERPASVVKELVENSLDAGARQITVETRQGGITFIRVTDDGQGIEPEELRIAFERHATSKLTSEEELWRIETLGFRGEALPSMAAAADVEMVSRPSGALVAGRVVLKEGVVEHQGSAGAPPGTSTTVQNLFQRQPGRLKFLRSAAAEGGQIANVVTQYALAYPEVRFTLRNDGREQLATPGNGDLRDTAAAVYSVDVAAELLPLDSQPQGAIQPLGLIGSPAISRANRSYISLFVNRRWIKHRALTFAIGEAYQGMLPVGRHPIAIVEVRLPPDQVDVNVHPAKAEVRFRDERAVFAVVQRAVRRTLSDRVPVPGVEAGLTPTTPPDFLSRGEGASPAVAGVAPTLSFQPQDARTTPQVATAEQASFVEQLPVLRPVGQLGNMYVIAEGPDGMYMVDQHAAHERVMYERFLGQQREGTKEVQPLLQPAPVELTARQLSLLESYGEQLTAMGLDIEPFGDGGYIVRAVPPSMTGKDAASAVPELLDLLGREDAPKEEPAHRVAASLACHGSVRAGQTMSDEEQRELLQNLEQCEHPRTCPHGRPTMVHMSSSELAKQFRRR